MYALARKILIANGYEHYEISNFALPGYKSRHNTAYWTGADYLGLGLGAHSLVNDRRYGNEIEIAKYISDKGVTKQNIEVLSDKDRQVEFMILGLRMMDGINCKDFSEKFDENIYRVYGEEIKDLTEKGLLAEEGDIIRLTPKGIDLSNQVFIKF
jgi:oxygen-independent coproporphyrinogen-3 oxidase